MTPIPRPLPAMLSGLRVLDFTWAWAGPYATTLLGFAGAEVVKVESRTRLDLTRRSTGHSGTGDQVSPSFSHINLNKRSITLNLSDPRAVALARDLVRVFDVVAENYRPGVMDKLGLGYEELRAIKPDLIMISSSTRGAKGPERRYAGYATIFASLSGLSHVTGYVGGPPTQFRNSMDLCSAHTMAIATLAAVYAWRRSGRGQHVDVSASEAAIALLGDTVLGAIMGGQSPARQGNADPVMAPHNCYPCRGEDSWISIAVGSEAEWHALRHAMGDPSWSHEERFAAAGGRQRHREEMDRLIGGWTAARDRVELAETLQRAGVAATPVMSSEDLYSDPHLGTRRKFVHGSDHERADVTVVGPPWRHSATPAQVERLGVALGQDNAHIFGEVLGLSSAEIDRLIGQRVLH